MTEALLAPLDLDSPCGPNLEYDADFLLLSEYASGKSEQQYGDTLIAAQPPDWIRVEQCATSLLGRTKDLRIVVQLTRAWMQARGIAGLARGVGLAASLLDSYWDAVHPQVSIEHESDPLPRINALRELAGAQGCPQAARDCPLLDGMSARAVAGLLARERTDGTDADPGRDTVVGRLHAAHERGEPSLASALAALNALRAMRETVQTRLGPEWAFDTSAFERDLSIIAECLNENSGPPVALAGDAEWPTTSDPQSRPAPAAPSPLLAIGTRADVERCLDALCEYFERHEPSHPAPLLLRRVRRLMTLDFYEIMRDIAPDGLRQVEWLSGRSAAQHADDDKTRT